MFFLCINRTLFLAVLILISHIPLHAAGLDKQVDKNTTVYDLIEEMGAEIYEADSLPKIDPLQSGLFGETSATKDKEQLSSFNSAMNQLVRRQAAVMQVEASIGTMREEFVKLKPPRTHWDFDRRPYLTDQLLKKREGVEKYFKPEVDKSAVEISQLLAQNPALSQLVLRLATDHLKQMQKTQSQECKQEGKQ